MSGAQDGSWQTVQDWGGPGGNQVRAETKVRAPTGQGPAVPREGGDGFTRLQDTMVECNTPGDSVNTGGWKGQVSVKYFRGFR